MSLDFLKDTSILVTGGTGSFGTAFVKFLLANCEARRIIIFSRDELKQYHLQREIRDSRLRFLLGDIRDEARLRRAFDGVDIVVHAAALKQVPALEYNPFEAVKTNIIGSQNVIDAAIDSGVEKVLLISTDKAAYPANLYGSTKLCAEKLFVSANAYTKGKIKLGAVRYGNVLGSRGSFVETILREKSTGVIRITHEEMTRFWINYSQACNLVAYALENMEGGEIFVPKLPSMKLSELVEALAPGIKREIIGSRPGEKIHEMLLTDQEARRTVELGKYYVVLPEFSYWSETRYEKYYRDGKKIDKEFFYTSDNNSDWLSPEGLLKMMEDN